MRPYCLAYVTHNYTRLMEIFQHLLHSFSVVSSLLHFGNTLNFIGELSARTEHLGRLKRVVCEPGVDICVDGKILTDSQKDSILSKDIDVSVRQLTELRCKFLQHSMSESYNEHREMFYESYNTASTNQLSTTDDGYNTVSTNQLTTTDDGYNTASMNVTTTDNCSDDVTTNDVVGSEDDVNSYEDFSTSSSSSQQQQHHFPSDVIRSLLGKRYDKPLRHLCELCGVTYEHSMRMLKSVVRTHCASRVDVNKRKSNIPIQKVDENNIGCSCLQGENMDFDQPVSLKCLLSKSAGCQRKFATQCYAGLYSGNDKRNSLDSINSSPLEMSGLYSTTSSLTGANSLVNSSQTFVSDGGGVDTSRAKSASMISRQTSSDSLADYDRISLTSSFVSSTREPSIVVPSGRNVLKCPQISLLKLRYKYSFLTHAVYSVLIGRPLVILGEEENKNKVRKLVWALSNFLQNDNSGKSVVPWLDTPLTLSHLGWISVVGVMKNRKGKSISTALKPYVSILNYEEETLLAPRYSGKFLSNMLNPSSHFNTDVSYRNFVLQMFTEFSAKTFAHFVNNNNNNNMQHSVEDVSATKGCPPQGDEAILMATMRHMGDTMLQQQQQDSCKPLSTIRLNTSKCSSFINNLPKKRR